MRQCCLTQSEELNAVVRLQPYTKTVRRAADLACPAMGTTGSLRSNDRPSLGEPLLQERSCPPKRMPMHTHHRCGAAEVKVALLQQESADYNRRWFSA